MKETIEKRIISITSGLITADSYLSEDLYAICVDTMREYAESTLSSIRKAASHADYLKKNLPLFLDALADIAMYVGHKNIEFEDSKERNITLRAWAQEFVDKYADADWEKMDYIILVDEFAAGKVDNLKF